MCEQLCPEDLLKNDINSLIKYCLKVEQDRKLFVNFIKELKRYLMEFGNYTISTRFMNAEVNWQYFAPKVPSQYKI